MSLIPEYQHVAREARQQAAELQREEEELHTKLFSVAVVILHSHIQHMIECMIESELTEDRFSIHRITFVSSVRSRIPDGEHYTETERAALERLMESPKTWKDVQDQFYADPGRTTPRVQLLVGGEQAYISVRSEGFAKRLWYSHLWSYHSRMSPLWRVLNVLCC